MIRESVAMFVLFAAKVAFARRGFTMIPNKVFAETLQSASVMCLNDLFALSAFVSVAFNVVIIIEDFFAAGN